MENSPHDAARSEGRTTAVIQAGLALLVAGTLVAFSFLAFRTGFAEGERGGVAAIAPEGGHRGPLVLPSGADRTVGNAGVDEESASEEQTSPASDVTDAGAVAGIRVRAHRSAGDRDASRGDRDDLDPVRKPAVAREEEDGDDDDHGGGDSWSADRSGKSASRGHSARGSRGDSGSHASRNKARGKKDRHASRDRSRGSRGHSRG